MEFNSAFEGLNKLNITKENTLIGDGTNWTTVRVA
jgi:hypothetical protein